MTNHCNNGGCTKPIYRGKECFRCWAGTKWDSMKQRVENRRGHYPNWAGLPLAMSRREFIEWACLAPPPSDMEAPSVDRINVAQGYSLQNIRWLESRQNSRNTQHNVPFTHRVCPACKQQLELSTNNFARNRSDPLGYSNYCKPCFNARYSKRTG